MTRNWKQVNNKYRNEGYLYLSFGFIESWKSEMKDLNYRKLGGQFKYPTSLIQYCSVLKAVFGLGFRQIDGFTKACFCRKPENIEQELLFKTILCNQMIA